MGFSHRSLLIVILLLVVFYIFLEVCCPVPNLNNYGSITLQRRLSTSNHCIYFSGDKISYECHNKYMFDATCTEYGTWSPRTPECRPYKTLWKHIFLRSFSYQIDGDYNFCILFTKFLVKIFVFLSILKINFF